MIVHTVSSLVLWAQVSATAPRDLRKRNMAMNMIVNTTAPMPRQT